MVELRIDGVSCPLADGRITLPKYDATKLSSVEAWREGERVEARIKINAGTQVLFSFAHDLHRVEEYNDSYHHGEVVVDGVELFTGKVTLLGVEHTTEGDSFKVEIRSGGAEWADSAALTHLNESSVSCSRTMDLRGIRNSWSDGGAVVMLPIHHDSYPEPTPTGLYVTQQMLLPQDYFPFLSAREIVQSIMSDSGYTLQSHFLDTTLARRLMLSGAYHSLNVEAAYAKMGFKAMRSTSTTATAASSGKVDLRDPVMTTNAGALVDTVNPNVEAEDGEPLSEAYANGGCFSFSSGVPTFKPKREISAAFDIHLRYTTDYRIVSSSCLKGFDTLYVGNGCTANITLQNPFRDMRTAVRSGIKYKLFIFNYDPTASYSLTGIGRVSAAISEVVFPSGVSSSVVLNVRAAGEVAYHRYTGDWALYEGYVEECGTRDVELTVRTPYAVYTPTSPRLFNDLSIEGAEEGQKITLHPRCSITPVFSGAAGYGELVSFADVANHDISQANLLEALAQMFNLRFYSHNASQTLYMEPYDTFYDTTIVDWRSRQLGDTYTTSECAPESFEEVKLGYQPADGATARQTMGEGKELGTWQQYNPSYAAKHAVDSRLNPLFKPSVSFTNLLPMAPSAKILTFGDRDIIEDGESVEPRIVLYYGLRVLPTGELWPTDDGRRYPYAAFHAPDYGQTLCFDDRDGCAGLHRYYDSEIKDLTKGCLLTTEIVLRPEEYLSLMNPATEGATIRSTFRLRVGGDSGLFHLDAIEDYDTEQYVAKCRFRRVMQE